jgi:DNA polymerase-3 subunit delta
LLYILYGPDEFTREQVLVEIKKSVSSEAAAGSNIMALDGSRVTVNEFKVACETVPFLAEQRLVIVNGLFARFESQVPKTRGKKNAHWDTGFSDLELIADCINNIPESTVLVLVDDAVNPKNTLFRQVAKKAKVQNFPMLRDKELPAWINRRVAGVGGRITSQAVGLLVTMIGNDLRTLANEIDKLVLYTAGRNIEAEDVRSIVSHARETSIFTLVDAIMEGKTGSAVALLQQMLQQGATHAYLLVMLARQKKGCG